MSVMLIRLGISPKDYLAIALSALSGLPIQGDIKDREEEDGDPGVDGKG